MSNNSKTIDQVLDDIWELSDQESVSLSRVGYTGVPEENLSYRVSIELKSALDDTREGKFKTTLTETIGSTVNIQDVSTTQSGFSLVVGV